MHLFAGIDGGGSKTEILLASADSQQFFQVRAGSASWQEHGINTVFQMMQQASNELAHHAGSGHLAGLVIGIPCWGENEKSDALLGQAAADFFPYIPVQLVNDAQVAWAGSLNMQPGINVVAGTGSIAYGRDGNEASARSGGWDAFFSDEGSGYWLGRNMMELFSKQADGRRPRSALYELVREHFHLQEDFEFIAHMRTGYTQNRKQAASLQLLLHSAAQAGDTQAVALYCKAAQELGSMVLAVKNQLDLPSENWQVSYSGSIFKSGGLILKPLEKMLKTFGATILLPHYTPVQGALLLAFAQHCPQGLTALRKRLSLHESYS